MLLLGQAEPEKRRQFAGEYRQARRNLSCHTVFFLRSPYFDRKERLRDLLLVLGLYRLVRPFFHKEAQSL